MAPLEVKNLKKHFGNVKAVDGIDITIGKGEIVGFLGPNGAGKTTTINCILNFLYPDSGSINVFGLPVSNDGTYKTNLGFLSSEVRLYGDWTGTEHIELLAQMRGVEAKYARELARELALDLKKKAKTLSTGNKQKLALILSMMHEPDLLILDEPTTGLDPLLQQKIYDIIRTLRKEGKSVFFSSHNLSEVEQVSDRVYILKEGKIIAEVPVDSKKKVYSPLEKTFLKYYK